MEQDIRSKPDYIVTSDELRAELGRGTGTPVLVDVREPEEHAECRIEGCKLIPLGELQARAESELKKDQDIVIYCAHGVRSMQGLLALRMMGFQKTRSLEGGIAAYLGLE